MMKLVENSKMKQYQVVEERHTAWVEYIKSKNRIFLMHTEVPKELDGKGIGTALVKLVLEDIDKKGLTLIPMCPFVAMFIKRHPVWRRLVLKGVKVD